MMFASLISLFLLAASPVFAQGDLSAAHNVTSLVGTWSSGSRNVVTGSGFANPANKSFTYPPTAGISYSFTGDGFFESARYRFIGNGTDPHCIVGVIVWIHGNYLLNDNGSMTLEPFADGYQQVQNACAAQSNFIETYNDTEIYQIWNIFQDVQDGPKLFLYQFDSAPLAPMFQVSTEPNMLPTTLLRNDTVDPALLKQVRAVAGGSSQSATAWTPATVFSLMSALTMVMLGSVLV